MTKTKESLQSSGTFQVLGNECVVDASIVVQRSSKKQEGKVREYQSHSLTANVSEENIRLILWRALILAASEKELDSGDLTDTAKRIASNSLGAKALIAGLSETAWGYIALALFKKGLIASDSIAEAIELYQSGNDMAVMLVEYQQEANAGRKKAD